MALYPLHDSAWSSLPAGRLSSGTGVLSLPSPAFAAPSHTPSGMLKASYRGEGSCRLCWKELRCLLQCWHWAAVLLLFCSAAKALLVAKVMFSVARLSSILWLPALVTLCPWSFWFWQVLFRGDCVGSRTAHCPFLHLYVATQSVMGILPTSDLGALEVGSESG